MSAEAINGAEVAEAVPATVEDLMQIIGGMTQRINSADMIIRTLLAKLGGEVAMTAAESLNVVTLGVETETHPITGAFIMRLVKPASQEAN